MYSNTLCIVGLIFLSTTGDRDDEPDLGTTALVDHTSFSVKF